MQEQPDKPKPKQAEKMLFEIPQQLETLQHKIDRFNQNFPDSRNLASASFWNPEKKQWELPFATNKQNVTDERKSLNKKD